MMRRDGDAVLEFTRSMRVMEWRLVEKSPRLDMASTKQPLERLGG